MIRVKFMCFIFHFPPGTGVTLINIHPWILNNWTQHWIVFVNNCRVAISPQFFVNQESCLGYVFPDGIQVLGWLVELFPLAIPLSVWIYSSVIKVSRGESFLTAFFRSFVTPSSHWGPREDRPKPSLSGITNMGMYDDVPYEKRTEL